MKDDTWLLPPEWAYCVFAACLALWVLVVAGVFVTSMAHQPKVWHEANDPYHCFGAGRYEAMSHGHVCKEWANK